MNLTTKKNWKTVKLGEVTEIRRGSSPRPIHDFLSSEGLPWVKISDATADETRYIQTTKQFIKVEGIKNTVVVNEGDFIISNSATPGLPKFMKITAGVHDGWLIVKPDESKIDKLFLYYQMLYDRPRLCGQASGAVFDNLKTDTVKEHEFPLPSLDEQREIAGVLGSLDDKIELLRKENKTLEEIAQTLFKEWFVNFNFPGATGRMIDSELGPIPEGWQVGKLGEAFKITMGQSPDGESYNENGEGMVFYQGRTEFGERFPSVRLYTTEPKRTAEAFDVLVSVRAPVGDLNQATQKCCLGRGVAGVSSDLKSFCFYMMKSAQSEIQKFEAGGTVFGSINKLDFENIQVVIPAQDVQGNFDLLAQPIDKKIFNNFSEIQTLSKLRDHLLNKIFSN